MAVAVNTLLCRRSSQGAGGSRWHQVAAAHQGCSPARSASAFSSSSSSIFLTSWQRTGPGKGSAPCHTPCRRCADSFPITASEKLRHQQRVRQTPHSFQGHMEEPQTQRAPHRPRAIPTLQGLSSRADREGIGSQGSKLNFITTGLTETGSTALASISKAPL